MKSAPDMRQGNNGSPASPNPNFTYADDMLNQTTNLAPGYPDFTGTASTNNNTNIANGVAGSDSTNVVNAGNPNNLNNQPGGPHYITINTVPILTWNNTGGTGDGITWDSGVNQNFNNGTAAANYSDGSLVTLNDANNSHYNVTLNSVVSPGSVTVIMTTVLTTTPSAALVGSAARVRW